MHTNTSLSDSRVFLWGAMRVGRRWRSFRRVAEAPVCLCLDPSPFTSVCFTNLLLMRLDIPSSAPSSPTRSRSGSQASPKRSGGSDSSRNSPFTPRAAGSPASSSAGHKRRAESQDLSQYALSITRRVRLKPADAEELMCFTKVCSVTCLSI